MKSKESIVEILEAYDLMGSFRGAASLIGVLAPHGPKTGRGSGGGEA